MFDTRQGSKAIPATRAVYKTNVLGVKEAREFIEQLDIDSGRVLVSVTTLRAWDAHDSSDVDLLVVWVEQQPIGMSAE